MTTSFAKSAASAAALCGLVLAAGMLSGPAAQAVPLAAVNHSFEADPNNANEFYFGDPAGW